ncbi:DEAD/DEAH box helicase [Archangium gephyra]|nr:DEAD/DEAH box helicase [Archangium gephyra]
MPSKKTESEALTRRRRIDPKLDDSGWKLPRGGITPLRKPFRTEEEETDAGPADYALWMDNKIVGVVEAKKVTVGPQSVLMQAERYAKGLRKSKKNYGDFRCPFLYATNGERIWFHDVRHQLNRSRELASFHTPSALKELIDRDFEGDCEKLLQLPHDHLRLRPYQKEANEAIDRAIADRRRKLLVAMATGTGKTFTMVNQVYRLMKSGVARRVLFLVDRRALAAQAVRAFASFEAERGKKFDKIYEVYSSRFQKEDFGEDEKFDPKVLPAKYLTDPKPGHAFVYVCTIQRMATHILGRQAASGLGEDSVEEDVDKLDIPIHAFDLVIADECHRGYTSQAESDWRQTLEHFDAIKIGLTATPALHTTAYFTHKAFEYSYKSAVLDGHLVEYDEVDIRSEVRMKGLFLREGENIEVVDPETGLSRMDTLEDERAFDTAALERVITAPDSNRRILEELKKHTDRHEQQYHRFPKTLIFAVNDLQHTSHADQLVELARDVFNQGDSFVTKITGRVDRPLQHIREFRNRPHPAIAVTVDLLSTGVDIPDLEFIVFLRPVKSRILFEQMIGRGTRLGEKLSDKSHFTVIDCFDGTLLDYFRNATGITADEPAAPSRTLREIIEDIWKNRDREYNVTCLIKRLQRIDKELSAEAREAFAAWIPDGDLAKYARSLAQALKQDFVKEMKRLRDPDFQNLLAHPPRPPRVFYRATDQVDTVTSTLRDSSGREFKPEDYLAAFSRFVRENQEQVEAIQILLDRPRDWGAPVLAELRKKLVGSRLHFTEEKLREAHARRYRKPLVDIISMVKHAANEEQPLLTASERVERAFQKVMDGKKFTPGEQKWLERIRQVMQQNLSIDREDFEYQDALSGVGGWGAARRTFGESRLDELLHRLNEAIAA